MTFLMAFSNSSSFFSFQAFKDLDALMEKVFFWYVSGCAIPHASSKKSLVFVYFWAARGF